MIASMFRFAACATLMMVSVPALAEGQQRPPQAKIQIKGRSLLRSGNPFYVKGVSYLPPQAWEKLEEPQIRERAHDDFVRIRDIGLNTVVLWPRTPSPVFDIAQELDLQVIPQVIHLGPHTNFTSNKAIAALEDEAKAAVRRDMHRPNVLMWRAWNDAPFKWGGQTDALLAHGLPNVEDVFARIVTAIKSTDPDRPVIGSNMLNCDFWNVGLQYVDVIGINYYLGIVDWFDGEFSVPAAISGAKQLDHISRVYRKPLLLTETGYSTFCAGMRQEDAIQMQLHVVGQTELIGFCLFEWSDQLWKTGDPNRQDANIEEHWGLTSAGGYPKLGLSQISSAIQVAPKVPLPKDEQATASGESPDQQIPLEDCARGGAQAALLPACKVMTGECTASLLSDATTDRLVKLEIIPEATGAWAELAWNWPGGVDLNGKQMIGFQASQDGPAVNLSLLLVDKDGERWKCPSWSPDASTKSKWFPLQEIRRDPHDPHRQGNNAFDQSTVLAHSYRITFPPGFEKVGERRVLLIGLPVVGTRTAGSGQ